MRKSALGFPVTNLRATPTQRSTQSTHTSKASTAQASHSQTYSLALRSSEISRRNMLSVSSMSWSSRRNSTHGHSTRLGSCPRRKAIARSSRNSSARSTKAPIGSSTLRTAPSQPTNPADGPRPSKKSPKKLANSAHPPILQHRQHPIKMPKKSRKRNNNLPLMRY